jgi:hypothetical protein
VVGTVVVGTEPSVPPPVVVVGAGAPGVVVVVDGTAGEADELSIARVASTWFTDTTTRRRLA